MAVGREPESVLVLGHTEGINLSLGVEFDTRAVGFEAEDITAGEFDAVSVGTLDFGDVIKAVACVDPAVSTISKGVDHAVGIARGIEGAEDDFALIADSVGVGIAKVVDIGDRESEDTIAVWEYTDRNIQSIGEEVSCFEGAVMIAVFESNDGVTCSGICCRVC